MRVTSAPVSTINFSWQNADGIRAATVLPWGFINAINGAIQRRKEYAEYTSEGGQRYVAYLTSHNIHILVNPTPEMVAKER